MNHTTPSPDLPSASTPDHVEIVISEDANGGVQVDHARMVGFRKYNVTWRYTTNPPGAQRFFAIVVTANESPFRSGKRIFKGKKKAVARIRHDATATDYEYDVYFERADGSIGYLDPIIAVSDEGGMAGALGADSEEIETRVENAILQQQEALEELEELQERLRDGH